MSNLPMAIEPSVHHNCDFHLITLPYDERNHFLLRDFVIEAKTQTISENIALFLGISAEWCDTYLENNYVHCQFPKSGFNGHYCRYKGITLEQLKILWDIAKNNRADKMKPILAQLIVEQVLPLFNKKDASNLRDESKQPLIHDDFKKEIDMNIITTNQLINIQSQQIDGQTVNAVSARELWKFLESKREFTNWVKPYVSADNAYGFIEGTDFIRFDGSVNPTNGVPLVDYWFTVDMAKEVSMLSKTEKGKQARKYFIDCERRSNNPTTPALPSNYKEALLALVAKEEQTEALALELKAKEQILEQAKPMIGFAETAQKANKGILVRDLAYLAQNDGMKIGEKRLWTWFRTMGFIHQRSTRPMQEYIERGYFAMQPTFVHHNSGMQEHMTTKITGKGQIYFLQKLKQFFNVGENNEPNNTLPV